jgi:trans-aconitate methyltransferase
MTKTITIINIRGADMRGALYFFILFLFIMFAGRVAASSQVFEHFKGGNDYNELLKETFDEIYPKLYNRVFYLKELFEFDAEAIVKRVNVKEVIVDVGAGSGHHLRTLHAAQPAFVLQGLERSRNMINMANIAVPDIKVVHGNYLNPTTFKPASIDCLLCLRDTLYHTPLNKLDVALGNFAKWLTPGGVLFLTIYDRELLEPSPREYSELYKERNGIIKSITYFKSFSHEAHWNKKLDKNVIEYNEKYLLENGHHKTVNTVLYMLPANEMIARVLKYGFKIKDIITYDKLGIPFMKLYEFQSTS